MFEIPSPKPLEQLSAIVIDQNALVRDSLKSLFYSIGLSYTRGASGANHALSEFRQQQFDIVIIAFDLNTDKDGFNLLEELKFKGFIKKSTTVIFLSADTDPELVNSIVELQPDDFWTKPLDHRKVKDRVISILNCRKLLHKPFYCADHKEYSRAIYHAERGLKQPKLKSFHPKLQRLIGDCLCELGDFASAETYYTTLLRKVDYSWVHIGQARALLEQGKLTEVQDYIEVLKARADTRFMTYDLLASHYVKNNDFKSAFIEIQQAGKLAPRNIERNKRVCDLAKLNHDAQEQYVSSFRMEKFARNSIHASPEITLNLIRASIDLAASTTPDAGASALHRASQQLRDLCEHNGANFKKRAQIVEARIMVTNGDKRSAESHIKGLKLSSLDLSFEDKLDLVKLYHALGNREKAIALLTRIKSELSEDAFSNPIIMRYIDQEIDEKRSIHFTPRELIDMASSHYKQKRYQPAFSALSDASKLAPTNVQITLNLLKTLVAIYEMKSLEKEHFQAIQHCMSVLSSEQLSTEQREKSLGYLADLPSNEQIEEELAEQKA